MNVMTGERERERERESAPAAECSSETLYSTVGEVAALHGERTEKLVRVMTARSC